MIKPTWRGIRTEDGITHGFRVTENQALRWKAICGVRRWLTSDRLSQTNDPIDCMACIAEESRP